MASYNFNKLKSRNLFNKMVQVTDEFDGEYRDVSKINISYFYRIQALITLGRFDDALRLSYEILDKSKSLQIRGHIYGLLSEIYYYQGDYFLSMYYNGLRSPSIKENSVKNLKNIVEMMASSKEDCDDRLRFVSFKKLRSLVEAREGTEINLDVNTMINIIQKDFDKAPTYYLNYACFKMFRCNNAGRIPHRSDDQVASTDYLKVIFRYNHPESILAIYPVRDVGDLDYYDFSIEYAERINRSERNHEMRKRTISRFYKRQAKRI